MDPTLRSRYRRISAALLLIVGLLVAWRGFVLLTPPSDHQTVRLENGSVVELLGYSFGKKHELRLQKPITNLNDLMTILQAAPVLRAADTDRDVLLLWVRIPHQLELHPGNMFLAYARGAGGYCYPSNMSNYTPVHYRVGNPYSTFQIAAGSGRVPTLQGEEILAVPIPCYPQREAQFAVDIAQYGGKQPLVTFHIANPNTQHPTPFTPEPLPATRQKQDLKVTLESITPGPRRQYVLPNGSTTWRAEKEAPKDGVRVAGEEGRQLVTLSYTEQGQPTTHWKISELTAYDATGNRTQEMALAPSWPCREYYPPTAGEPYKLRLGIQKTWGNHYDADELWTVTDIPLPTHGKPVAIGKDFRRDDLHLHLVRVYGMGGKNFSPDLALVQIKVDSIVSNPVLLVHAEDEQGRMVSGPWADANHMYGSGCTFVEQGNVTQMHTGFVGDNDPHYRTVPLKIPKDMKRLKLIFTLPRTHFFEFVVPMYQHSPE